jgi:hypothetical protein
VEFTSIENRRRLEAVFALTQLHSQGEPSVMHENFPQLPNYIVISEKKMG